MITETRKQGWERSFVEVVSLHSSLPFSWGVSDCLIFAADLATGMVGIDPMADLREYSDEKSAMRVLLKAGYRSVEDALQDAFPLIPVSYARRGDCGVLEQSVNGSPWLSTLIVLGDRAVGKGPNGPVYVPTTRLKNCYAIGAL